MSEEAPPKCFQMQKKTQPEQELNAKLKSMLGRLEKYKPIEEWKAGLTRGGKSKTLSTNTWISCLKAMRNYLVFVNIGPDAPMTPNDLIKEAKQDIIKATDRVDKCFLWLQGAKNDKGELEVQDRLPREKVLELISADGEVKRMKATISASVAHQIAYSRIAGFYRHNRTPFPKGTTPILEQESKVSEIDALFSFFKTNKKTKKKERDATLFIKIFRELTSRDKTIILSLLTAGQDPVDLFSLNVGFIRQFIESQKHQKEPLTRIRWAGTRIKSKIRFKTLFSEEVTPMLIDYVEKERKDAKDNDPIFVNNRGKRMSTNLIDKILREAQERVGLRTNGNHSPYRPKRMRHIFIQTGDVAGLAPGIIDVLAGQKTSGARKVYMDKSWEELEGYYARMEPFLTIFHDTIEESTAKTQEELKQTEQKLQNLEGNVAYEVLHLNKQIRENQKERNELLERVKELETRTQRYDAYFEKFMDSSPDELAEVLDVIRQRREEEIDQEYKEAVESGKVKNIKTKVRSEKEIQADLKKLEEAEGV